MIRAKIINVVINDYYDNITVWLSADCSIFAYRIKSADKVKEFSKAVDIDDILNSDECLGKNIMLEYSEYDEIAAVYPDSV